MPACVRVSAQPLELFLQPLVFNNFLPGSLCPGVVLWMGAVPGGGAGCSPPGQFVSPPALCWLSLLIAFECGHFHVLLIFRPTTCLVKMS